MKTERIRKVNFNNRRHLLTIQYASGKKVDVHYSGLGIEGGLEAAWVDSETGGLSVGLRLRGGREDFMPYDQPLAITRDPEFLLQNQIERMIARIRKEMTKKRISKRFLALQLRTSDNQIQRLLDPAIVNKNPAQLYKIAALIGMEMEWRVRRAA